MYDDVVSIIFIASVKSFREPDPETVLEPRACPVTGGVWHVTGRNRVQGPPSRAPLSPSCRPVAAPGVPPRIQEP